MVNILITGSSGYLGENLILKLFKQKKYKITGIDIKPNKKTEGLIRFVNADISNGEALKQNLNNMYNNLLSKDELDFLNQSLKTPIIEMGYSIDGT